ncbi:hypothetical protein O6H91_03G114100 [Diphasiastrum complanatum]|uniref:Uncharacterized protein n=1 Tax=Diphasiastrum complanatum TaxID=34168 RepID=A0ACC2EAK8_DIPCM|nr:hypothetical protein O6H91_Y322400 [Diphasiastrum complanatum]KAJ7563529.1 hypothetical protein O6H91_03G114100 [Diphasiastrum complanatum]
MKIQYSSTLDRELGNQKSRTKTMAYTAGAAIFLSAIYLFSQAAGRLVSSSPPTCTYSIYIRTGGIIKGGTDSNIGVQLFDSSNNSITVSNLVPWGGLMPEGHDYYEQGSLDIFSGLEYCLATPICKLIISSDGSGPHHGWYVNYLEITSTGPHIPCTQHLFTLEQWLARDAYPYELTAVRDDCKYVSDIKLTHGTA